MHVFCVCTCDTCAWLAGWLYVCMYVYSHLDKCIAHNAWHQRTRPRSPDVEEDTADMEDDIIVQVDAVQQEAATEDADWGSWKAADDVPPEKGVCLRRGYDDAVEICRGCA